MMCYKKRRKNLVIRDLFDETSDVLEYSLKIHVAIKIKSTCSVKIFFLGGGGRRRGVKQFCSIQLDLKAPSNTSNLCKVKVKMLSSSLTDHDQS